MVLRVLDEECMATNAMVAEQKKTNAMVIFVGITQANNSGEKKRRRFERLFAHPEPRKQAILGQTS